MSVNTDEEVLLDETLDPIPVTVGRDEMSYIYGRDPSILSYGQRPGPSVETKKNLYSVYEVEETGVSLDVSSVQTIKVFLRLKPFGKKIKLTAQEEEAYQITSSTNLMTKLPSIDTHSSIRSSSVDVICRKYTFTETFGPDVSQAEFFERVLQPQMPEFLSGQNATIMTYGTTNSGKSFTLQGTSLEPGLIPRSLEHLFGHINPRETPDFKPINSRDITKLSSTEKITEMENKIKLLTYGTSNRNEYINAFKKMQQVLRSEAPETRSRQSTDAHCAVWVSFAEIYNETIYDLLSNDTSKRRPVLKLGTDSQGFTYIKGLKSVFVNSGCEAYQVLMAGQYNLKVAATALNSRSSRSHCIFTIKLLKYTSENDPKSVEMSTFTFCDLAGSERLKKTLNIGDRLKEAQNINTSLMVLGRCLKSIYDVQTVKQQRSEVVGPFRESKLTRLFQAALSGKEPIALIVNVNPSPNLYVETQNVLNFAAMAKKIIVPPKVKKPRKSKTRFSHLVMQTKDTITNWDEPTNDCDLESVSEQSSVEEMGYVPAEDYEQLLEDNENLRREISQMKSTAFKKDLATREEISKFYMETIKRMEEDHKARLRNIETEHQNLHEWELEKVESFYQSKLLAVKSCKRKRSEDSDDEIDDTYLETSKGDLEIQVEQLNSKVEELKEKLKQTMKEKEEVIVQKNSISYELSLVTEQLKASNNMVVTLESVNVDDTAKAHIDLLKQQLEDSERKRKNLQVTLNEAKKDFMELRNELDSKEYQINKLEIELVHKDEGLSDAREDYRNLEDLFHQRESVIRDFEETIDIKSQENQKLKDELYASEANYKQLRELFDVMSKRNSSVEASTGRVELSEEQEEVNKKVCDGVSQTTSPNTVSQSNQTSFVESVENKSLQTSINLSSDENDIYKDKFEDMKQKYQEEFERAAELSDALEKANNKLIKSELLNKETEDREAELEECRATIDTLEAQNEELRTSRDYYRSESHSIEKELKEHQEVITRLTGQLAESKKIRAELVAKLTESEQRIDELKVEKESYKTELAKKTEELSEVKDKIESLENDLKAKESLVSSVQKELESKSQLESKIRELNLEINKCHEREKELEEEVKVNKIKIEELEKTVSEKDKEIHDLQKDIKETIKLNSNDNTEKELKLVIKERDEARERASEIDKLNKKLQTKLNNNDRDIEEYRKKIKKLEDERQEVESLEERFQKTVQGHDLEMVAFKKNQEETIAKYEYELKRVTEERDKEKREVKRLQDTFVVKGHTPKDSGNEFRAPSSDRSQYKLRENKPPKEETSEDESVTERRGRRARKALVPTSPNQNINITIDASETESTRSTRKTTAKTTCPSTGKKQTRGRRLYTAIDDGQLAIPITPETVPSPSPTPSTRSLRARKNK